MEKAGNTKRCATASQSKCTTKDNLEKQSTAPPDVRFVTKLKETITMFYSNNKEILLILCLSTIWFLSNVTILRSKEVRYQEFGPLFTGSLVPDYPNGGLPFLHPLNRSRTDHLLMLYAPWDAESVQAKPAFTALALLNPQIAFVAVACWNVSSECWQRFRSTRFPTFALLLTGLSEVVYSGPVEVSHLQKFLTEAPLGYRTVATDEELVRYTQLHDNVVLGCYNLSASPVVPGLHQFYAASVQSFDLFSPLPFLVPVYAKSDHFHCGHNGQVILLRCGAVALTPDVSRPLHSTELQGWLRQHRVKPTLSVLNSPGVKSRRLLDLATSPEGGRRPLLIVFDPAPRHWESRVLARLRVIDAVYARGCGGGNAPNASSSAGDAPDDDDDDVPANEDDVGVDDKDFESAMSAAAARSADERRRRAEAAALGSVCASLLDRNGNAGCYGIHGNAGCYGIHGCNGNAGCYGIHGCNGNAGCYGDAWQRLYGQRPAGDWRVWAGRLHRLCLLAPPAVSAPPSRPRQREGGGRVGGFVTRHAARSLRRFGCSSGGNATDAAVAMVTVDPRRQPHLLRGLLAGSGAPVPPAVIVDLAAADGGVAHPMKPGSSLSLLSLVRFILDHHRQQHRRQDRPKPHLRTSGDAEDTAGRRPVRLTQRSLPGFARRPGRDALVLFHSPACVYSGPHLALAIRLAAHLGSRIPLGTVDVSAEDLDPTWAPPRVPALLLFPRWSKLDPVAYAGPAGLVPLMRWLARHASEPLGLRALTGGRLLNRTAAAAVLEGHAVSLQRRLTRALEVARFADERTAEARWSLAALTGLEWLRLAAGVGLHARLVDDRLGLERRRARMFRRLAGRCRRLVDAYASRRGRSQRLVGALRTDNGESSSVT